MAAYLPQTPRGTPIRGKTGGGIMLDVVRAAG